MREDREEREWGPVKSCIDSVAKNLARPTPPNPAMDPAGLSAATRRETSCAGESSPGRWAT